MTNYNEETLAELLRTLPAPPQAWVRAAQEIPLARRGLDEIVERARADRAFRDALIADLERRSRRRATSLIPCSSRRCANASRPSLDSAPVADLLDAPLRDFLDTLAGEGPAPGGGSAAAIVVAMSAGLVGMVARASKGQWDEAGGAIGQAESLRARVSPLAQADADAYMEALTALRGKGEVEPRYRDIKLREALELAADIPLQIAEAGCDLAHARRAARRERQPGGARGRGRGGSARRRRDTCRSQAGRRQPRRERRRRPRPASSGTRQTRRRGDSTRSGGSGVESSRCRRTFGQPGVSRPERPTGSPCPSNGRFRSRANGRGEARRAKV